MKNQLLLMVLSFLLGFTTYSYAQDYALSAPFGYGASATGGEGGTVVTVTTASDLESYLTKSGKYIILVSGEITLSDIISETVTNKTVIGLPDSKLINTSTTSSTSGILYINSGSNNVILRNLTFEGPGAYDIDGRDNLCLDGGTDIWVDHCDFQDGLDGNFDIKGKSDDITITWCRFHYLKDPIAGGSGGSDDHRYTNLVGSSSSDKPSDGLFSITYAYNWWDEGCKERMPRCRNAELDFFSCYWNSSVANYYIGPENVTLYVEGCWFQGESKSTIMKEYNSSTNYCNFVDSYGSVDGVPSSQGTVSAPSYDYTAYTYSDTKEFVSNEYCGAGATLSVDTSTGDVYADCTQKLSTPSGISTTSTTSSITINWDAVDYADSYVLNICSAEEGTSVTDVTAVLDDDTSTDGYFTLSSGDKLYTSVGAGNSSTACAPDSYSGTIYRTSSTNDLVLELTATSDVTTITFGGRSSGTTSNRTLTSYSINSGDAQTDGIDGQITAQGCTTEITISGLSLTQGDQVAFTFDGNVQLSYFELSNGSSLTCEEITVTDNSYTISDLAENTSITYQVKAQDSYGDYTESNYSTERSAVADGSSTDIKTITDDIQFLQYNNTIEIADVNVEGIDLYSITGSRLKSNSYSQTMDISSLRTGLYIVVIKTTDGQMFSKKVIKK